MAAKSLPKNSSMETRLLGVERRLTRIEEKSQEVHMDIVRLSNQSHHLEDTFIKMEDRFMTSFEEFRSKMVTLIDPLFGQLKKFNEEQNIHEGQHKEEYDEIQSLKKIHPNNKHVFPSTASV